MGEVKKPEKKSMATPVAAAKALEVIQVSSSVLQNNFGKFLDKVRSGAIVSITKNNREVARIVSTEEDWYQRMMNIPESEGMKKMKKIIAKAAKRREALGIKGPIDYDKEREAYLLEKYGPINGIGGK